MRFHKKIEFRVDARDNVPEVEQWRKNYWSDIFLPKSKHDEKWATSVDAELQRLKMTLRFFSKERSWWRETQILPLEYEKRTRDGWRRWWLGWECVTCHTELENGPKTRFSDNARAIGDFWKNIWKRIRLACVLKWFRSKRGLSCFVICT